MKKSFITSSAIVAAYLVLGALSIRAEKGHDHSKHGHSGHEHKGHDHASDAAKPSAAMSSHDGMTSLYQHLGEMEKEIAAGNLDGIHGHDEAIQAAVKDLDKDTTLTVEKKQRVQGYVKNVLKLSGKLHSAADGKKLDQAKKEIDKLKAQVDLLDKQFAHSHKPGAEAKGKQDEVHHHSEK